MSMEKSSESKNDPNLIFACSGAADVGEITDRVARKMTTDGIGKMFCLAGIGGKVTGIMEITEKASDILAIDGCLLNCTKNCLEQAGFENFKYLQLADMGLEKGNSPASDENISKVIKEAAELMN